MLGKLLIKQENKNKENERGDKEIGSGRICCKVSGCIHIDTRQPIVYCNDGTAAIHITARVTCKFHLYE